MKANVCDCQRGHNGIGLSGRECDCMQPESDGWQSNAEAHASALCERSGIDVDDWDSFKADLESTLIEFAEWTHKAPTPPVPEPRGKWQWRSRIKGGAWDAWEQGRFGQEVPPFMEVEERPVPEPEADWRTRALELESVLVGLSSSFGAGTPSEPLSPQSYDRRIREGIEITHAPMVEAWQRSLSEGKR